jgi:hypothetical protein
VGRIVPVALGFGVGIGGRRGGGLEMLSRSYASLFTPFENSPPKLLALVSNS